MPSLRERRHPLITELVTVRGLMRDARANVSREKELLSQWEFEESELVTKLMAVKHQLLPAEKEYII